MRRALFLDRDGIVNQVVFREGELSSPRSLEELVLIPEAATLASWARQVGFLLILITNQPDVSRRLLSPKTLKSIHQAIEKHIPLDHIEVCTSAKDSYRRRKPNPGMLLDSAEKYQIDLPHSFFLGDSLKDLQAGKRAGVLTILLQTAYNRSIHGLGDINCNCFEEIQYAIKTCL